MKPAGSTRAAAPSPGRADGATPTRERVLAVVVEHGPVTVGRVAEVLGLTPAGVRRHLEAMALEGLVADRRDHRAAPGTPGRPARAWTATPPAPAAGPGAGDGHGALAVDLLDHLAETAGPDGVRAYARRRAQQLRERYAPAVAAAGPSVRERAEALAGALRADGYAGSTRPVDTGTGVAAVQLCQGRCPLHAAATAHPELCSAEAEAFSDLLGVGTHRLATIGGGAHACTTHVPLAAPAPRPAAAGARAPRHREPTGTQTRTTSSSPEGHRR
jgi:predicted ArsR family transcriptional regulator